MSSFRDRVVAYYEVHNPTKLDSVDEICRRYADREAELWQKLDAKYTNFRSRNFNALAALNGANVVPPVPDAPILDNISKFRPYLPSNDASYDSRVLTKPTPRPPKISPGSDLLTTITDPLRAGPYSLLWRALEERRRIKVVIRQFTRIRGTCVGLLKAFDRHMNLYLIDVTETTRRTRRLGSLLIRGDVVVLVCLLP